MLFLFGPATCLALLLIKFTVLPLNFVCHSTIRKHNGHQDIKVDVASEKSCGQTIRERIAAIFDAYGPAKPSQAS